MIEELKTLGLTEKEAQKMLAKAETKDILESYSEYVDQTHHIDGYRLVTDEHRKLRKEIAEKQLEKGSYPRNLKAKSKRKRKRSKRRNSRRRRKRCHYPLLGFV